MSAVKEPATELPDVISRLAETARDISSAELAEDVRLAALFQAIEQQDLEHTTVLSLFEALSVLALPSTSEATVGFVRHLFLSLDAEAELEPRHIATICAVIGHSLPHDMASIMLQEVFQKTFTVAGTDTNNPRMLIAVFPAAAHLAPCRVDRIPPGLAVFTSRCEAVLAPTLSELNMDQLLLLGQGVASMYPWYANRFRAWHTLITALEREVMSRQRRGTATPEHLAEFAWVCAQLKYKTTDGGMWQIRLGSIAWAIPSFTVRGLARAASAFAQLLPELNEAVPHTHLCVTRLLSQPADRIWAEDALEAGFALATLKDRAETLSMPLIEFKRQKHLVALITAHAAKPATLAGMTMPGLSRLFRTMAQLGVTDPAVYELAAGRVLPWIARGAEVHLLDLAWAVVAASLHTSGSETIVRFVRALFAQLTKAQLTTAEAHGIADFLRLADPNPGSGAGAGVVSRSGSKSGAASSSRSRSGAVSDTESDAIAFGTGDVLFDELRRVRSPAAVFDVLKRHSDRKDWTPEHYVQAAVSLALSMRDHHGVETLVATMQNPLLPALLADLGNASAEMRASQLVAVFRALGRIFVSDSVLKLHAARSQVTATVTLTSIMPLLHQLARRLIPHVDELSYAEISVLAYSLAKLGVFADDLTVLIALRVQEPQSVERLDAKAQAELAYGLAGLSRHDVVFVDRVAKMFLSNPEGYTAQDCWMLAVAFMHARAFVGNLDLAIALLENLARRFNDYKRPHYVTNLLEAVAESPQVGKLDAANRRSCSFYLAEVAPNVARLLPRLTDKQLADVASAYGHHGDFAERRTLSLARALMAAVHTRALAKTLVLEPLHQGQFMAFSKKLRASQEENENPSK